MILLLSACNVDSPPTTPPSPTESVENPAPGDHRFTLEWNGKPRSFLVHAPPGYDAKTPLPLVVTMHYYPGDSAGIATTSGMSAKADKENFLVLYPDGWSGGMNALMCCGSEDDVGLISTLVQRMVKRWNADPKRIYATGISNGGDMAVRLAVELPGVFAAIAPVSGGLGGAKAADPEYKPKSAVSVITFLGGTDKFFSSFTRGMQSWQERLACKETAVTGPSLPNGIKQTASKCADGSDVVVYELPSMGHSWPGAQAGSLADPNAGISATDLMWEFFKNHRAG